MSKPVVIGITGGSGSGKTTISRELYENFGGKNITKIEMDSYYKDQSHLELEERVKTNYDHPDAFDTELLVEHVKDLMGYKAIEKPIYDFTAHTRKKETERIEPTDIIIVEGILTLQSEELIKLMDIKIFVDTDADVRFIRRLIRDMNERGRSMESVVNQYLDVVRPMHMQFTEPSKRNADLIIPEGGFNKVAIDILTSKVSMILADKE